MKANDRCWCGSGDKYKDCCQEDDKEQRERGKKLNSRASRFRPKDDPLETSDDNE